MADLIKKIKIKKEDGTYTDYIPIGAEAKNISTKEGESVQAYIDRNNAVSSFLTSSIANSTSINYSYSGYNWFTTTDISGIEDNGRYIVEYIVSTASANSLYALQRFTLVSSNTPKVYTRALNNGTWSNLIRII